MVLGPTASGKSEFGVSVAKAFGGEIVNFDSVQVYTCLNIGSAKLPFAERRDIPHHLLDILEVDQELTAGQFSRLARQELAGIQNRGTLPVLVGGTGFYLRALLDGLSPAPPRDVELRQRLAALASRRPSFLHRLLQRRDPIAAGGIHPNDLQKLIRALELLFLSGRPASDVQAAPRDKLAGFRVLKLGLAPDRCELRRRIDRRTERMFNDGLLAETQRILDSGTAPSAKGLQSLGYKQASAVLMRGMPLDEAVRDCQIKTRQYAKRQMTWFRAETDVEWLNGFGNDAVIQDSGMELVRNFLRGDCAEK